MTNNKFELYEYTKENMDSYHQHVYESFGDINWYILMNAFIDSVCVGKTDNEAKDLIDEFIHQLIQHHYNT